MARARAPRAVELVVPRAESPYETIFRLFWLEAGLPRREVNVPVDDRDGQFLGRPDLLCLAAGLVAEFDGSDCRSAARHRADNAREERLDRAELLVVRLDAVDVDRSRSATQRRLVAAHSDGVYRTGPAAAGECARETSAGHLTDRL